MQDAGHCGWLATWEARGPTTSSRLPRAVAQRQSGGGVCKDTEMASVLHLTYKRWPIQPAQTNSADPFLKGP